MKKTKIFSYSLFILFFTAILSLSVLAQNASKISEIKILSDGYGRPLQITISGHVKEKEAWLGISFYPKSAKDYVKEAEHKIEPLKEGDFYKAPFIDSRFIGGTYEVALWSKKVERKDCTIQGCQWCKKNGFHMEGRLDYKWGSIVGTAK